MNLQDCIQFATENPICYAATVEGDQPRVRVLALWAANTDGFYFAILSPKRLSKQLKANPRMEVCFYNNPPDLGKARQMRVSGKVEFVHDKKLLKKAIDEGGFLEKVTGRPLADLWEVIRIHSGEAYFWTLPDSMKEAELERIHF